MKYLIHNLEELLEEEVVPRKEKIKHKEKFDDGTVPESTRGRDKKRRRPKR